ncbi:hypothetical protein KFE25_007701 [Diacronema lutheri]|uniref:Aminotransferase class I/classII large domain-containing protein n=1 Tax=Diacronema lutheri TaxID=2081491 RepID=A0A8J5XPM5_DIALT|nr:hypothetical protein KFE25_007701 [Diacronema lutheri]
MSVDDAEPLLPESALSKRLFRPPLRAIMMPAVARKRAGEDVALLAGGCPHPTCSAVHSVAVRLRDVGLGASCAAAGGSGSQASAGALVPPPGAVTRELLVDGALRDVAFNYHDGAGVAELLELLEPLQLRLHAPHAPSGPGSAVHAPPFAVTLTSGNSDALLKAIELLTDPGDVVLVEAFAWPTTLAMCLTRGRAVVGVPLDADGLDVGALRAAAARYRGRAKVLAVTPSGHNPTGITYSDARRRDVYDACREAGLCILEDDPYCFLHTPLPARMPADARARSTREMRGLAPCGERGQPLSLLAIDARARGGRVVRLDSFSKMLAPGLRLGWLSAPARFVAKFRLLTEASSQHPSGVSQAVVCEMLRAWGDAGLDAHLRAVQLEYTRRRDVLLGALERAFAPAPSDAPPLASWEAPTCGMFVWLRQTVCEDTVRLAERLAADGVACVPGAFFSPPVERPDGEPEPADGADAPSASAGRAPCAHIRLTFASASDEDMVAGCERIAAALRRDAAERAATGAGTAARAQAV